MSRRYEASIQFDCWKQHVCVVCSCAFRYRFQRTISGEASTAQAARKEAQRAALEAIQTSVDLHPCPGCTHYQPDMIGSWRALRHGAVLFIATFVFLLLALPVYLEFMPRHVYTWLAMGVAAVVALLHWRYARWDPNRDLDANRAKVGTALRSGEVELLRPGKMDESKPPPDCGFTAVHWWTFFFLVVGVLVVGAPETLRLVLRWPLNRAWSPVVVGPGEKATFSFPDKLESVKGLWQGDADVKLLNAEELGVRELRFESSDNGWGGSIRTKMGSSTESWHPWVRVDVPNDPKLAGKELRLDIAVRAKYPSSMGVFFDEKTQSFHTTTALRLATMADAGDLYRKAWWVGLIGGPLWMVFVGLALRQFQLDLRAKALPTLVVPIKEEEKTEKPTE